MTSFTRSTNEPENFFGRQNCLLLVTPLRSHKLNGRQYVVIYAAGGFGRRGALPPAAVPPGGMQAGGHQPVGVPPTSKVSPEATSTDVPRSGGIYVAFALPDSSAVKHVR